MRGARNGGDKFDGEETGRERRRRREREDLVLARVASRKASGPTPLGLAPERQSGLRALIITRPRGREKVPRARFPLHARGSRYPVRICRSRGRTSSPPSPSPLPACRCCRQLGKSRLPHSRTVDGHRGREEEPPHDLSLRVAALQHSRLPRPFRGAGTTRFRIHARNARTRWCRGPPVYTRGRAAYTTALNPDGDFSTPTPPREVWG